MRLALDVVADILANVATSPPWRVRDNTRSRDVVDGDGNLIANDVGDDAPLLAAAPDLAADLLDALDGHRTRADAAVADRDYWREQATGMAPSVDGMRALGTRLFPGGTGCVVDPERVVAEVERLREERNAAVAARDALTEEVEQLRASHATLILLVDRLAADRRQLYTRLREVMPWVGYCPFNPSQAREMFLSRDFASDTLKEVSLDLDRAEIVSTSVVVEITGDDDGKDDQ